MSSRKSLNGEQRVHLGGGAGVWAAGGTGCIPSRDWRPGTGEGGGGHGGPLAGVSQVLGCRSLGPAEAAGVEGSWVRFKRAGTQIS